MIGPPSTANLGGGSFFIGIGFASVKQLVGVDKGFTPLSFGNPHRSLSTISRWGFSFPPLHAAPYLTQPTSLSYSENSTSSYYQVRGLNILKDLNMSRIAYLTMIFLLCMSTIALAETEIVISKKNKFGGITKKIKYFEQDDSYKAGIQQTIDYYDSQGNRRKIEIYKSRSHSQKLDLDMIIYYKSTGRVFEVYSPEKEMGREKISKRVSHYSKDDKLQKREYYFDRESPVSKLGVDKRVIYYDDAGGATRVEHIDKSGKRVMPQ